MITKVLTLNEFKRIFTQILLNKTDKLSKVSDESTNNAIAYGVAKIAQKAMKDVSLVEGQIFPDSAFGDYLDKVADNYGIAPRFGAAGSTTFVRVNADPGTTYESSTHFFKAQGSTFEIFDDFTVGPDGYGYIKVKSQTTGLASNVESLSINSVSPAPAGHLFVVNEYQAIGGRDQEGDEEFRLRIKEGPNLLARHTLAYFTQVFIKFNSNILRTIYKGTNDQNQSVLGVSTQNGADLSQNELNTLLEDSREYLNIHEYNGVNNNLGVVLENVEYYPVDIDFRCRLLQSSIPDEVRKENQVAIAKYFDFRIWNKDTIEWDDLLEITKETPGVQYIADAHFLPHGDIKIKFGQLPRVRSYIMRDLDGNIIVDNLSILDPVYYPNEPITAIQGTIQ